MGKSIRELVLSLRKDLTKASSSRTIDVIQMKKLKLQIDALQNSSDNFARSAAKQLSQEYATLDKKLKPFEKQFTTVNSAIERVTALNRKQQDEVDALIRSVMRDDKSEKSSFAALEKRVAALKAPVGSKPIPTKEGELKRFDEELQRRFAILKAPLGSKPIPTKEGELKRYDEDQQRRFAILKAPVGSKPIPTKESELKRFDEDLQRRINALKAPAGAVAKTSPAKKDEVKNTASTASASSLKKTENPSSKTGTKAPAMSDAQLNRKLAELRRFKSEIPKVPATNKAQSVSAKPAPKRGPGF